MSKECTTHHFACDCREEKFKQLEQENAALREERDALKDALEYEVVDTQRLHWLLVDRIKNKVQP